MSDASTADQVFSYLKGEWQVCRQFEGSYRGTFTGAASLVPEADDPLTCLYREMGKLVDADGQHFDAKQNYLYRLSDGQLKIYKHEDSEWIIMHELDFTREGDRLIAKHLHLCGQDRYAVEYKVDLSGNWEQSYIVTGPKKDYSIRSVYKKVVL